MTVQWLSTQLTLFLLDRTWVLGIMIKLKKAKVVFLSSYHVLTSVLSVVLVVNNRLMSFTNSSQLKQLEGGPTDMSPKLYSFTIFFTKRESMHTLCRLEKT